MSGLYPNPSFQFWKCPATPDPLLVVAIQASVSPPMGERIDKAIALLEAAYAEHGKGIFLFPEYFLMNYHERWQDTVAMAEEIPGPSTEAFMQFAKKTGSYVAVGMLEKSEDAEHPYNSIAVFGSEGAQGSYRKTHLWDSGNKNPDRANQEYLLFTAGKELPIFEMFGHKVGIMICADGTYPEVPRTLRLKGAELLLYPNGRDVIGAEADALAKANLLPVVVSNPIGNNGHAFGGSSRVISPWGTTLAAAMGMGYSPLGVATSEGWAAAELDMASISKLGDAYCEMTGRRPELYEL